MGLGKLRQQEQGSPPPSLLDILHTAALGNTKHTLGTNRLHFFLEHDRGSGYIASGGRGEATGAE
jgi:hypothetical protein